MISDAPNGMGAKHVELERVRKFLEWVEGEHGLRTRKECERQLSTFEVVPDLFRLLQRAQTAIHARAGVNDFQQQPLEFNT